MGIKSSHTSLLFSCWNRYLGLKPLSICFEVFRFAAHPPRHNHSCFCLNSQSWDATSLPQRLWPVLWVQRLHQMQAQALHLPGAQWHSSDRRVPRLLPHGILWHEESRRKQQMHAWVLLLLYTVGTSNLCTHTPTRTHIWCPPDTCGLQLLAGQLYMADVRSGPEYKLIWTTVSWGAFRSPVFLCAIEAIKAASARVAQQIKTCLLLQSRSCFY